MEQIIGSFSVVIISDPCHPWEPDWYSISCVSCWFTELCSCYLPYWSSVAETKIQVRMYFSVEREALQWLSRLARRFLRPVTSLLVVQAMELAREILPAVDYNETRPISICDGNWSKGQAFSVKIPKSTFSKQRRIRWFEIRHQYSSNSLQNCLEREQW